MQDKKLSESQSQFLMAMTNKNYDIAEDLLKKGQNPNVTREAIFNAVQQQDIKAVELLIKYKVNVNSRGVHGDTPLHWATKRGEFDINLMKKEIKLPSKTQEACDVLQRTLSLKQDNPTVLMINDRFFVYGNPDGHGWKFNEIDEHDVKLHRDIFNTNLLKYPKSAALCDHLISRKCHSQANCEIVLLLLKAGAQVTANDKKEIPNLNNPDAEGNTPLLWALKNNDIPSVKLLLNQGVSTGAMNKNGETAEYLATYHRYNNEIINLLMNSSDDLEPENNKSPSNAPQSHSAQLSPQEPPLTHTSIASPSQKSPMTSTSMASSSPSTETPIAKTSRASSSLPQQNTASAYLERQGLFASGAAQQPNVVACIFTDRGDATQTQDGKERRKGICFGEAVGQFKHRLSESLLTLGSDYFQHNIGNKNYFMYDARPNERILAITPIEKIATQQKADFILFLDGDALNKANTFAKDKKNVVVMPFTVNLKNASDCEKILEDVAEALNQPRLRQTRK